MGSNGCKGIGVTKRFRQDKGPKPVEEEYVEVDFKNVKPPALFIDGYNIIGYINSVESRNIPLDDARDCLISDLCVLCTATGWFIEVVFDAYKVKSPEKTEVVDSIQVTYTGADETADNHIERRFQELSNSGYTNMVVATDDNVLRMVAGSAGAGYLSASMLLEELRIAYRGWEDMEEEMQTKAKVNRPKIEDGLSDEMREAIATLKRNAIVAAQEQAAAKLAQELVTPSSQILVKAGKSSSTSKPKVAAASKPILDKDLYKKRKKGASVANTGAWDVGDLRRPTVADGLSDELRNAIEKLKKEEEAAGRLC
jgi:predicted RNA-binding protein with PIN domain